MPSQDPVISGLSLIGHNGGPPLDPDGPEWGDGNPYRYFRWKAAHKAAWRQPREIALGRLARAERIGLTYEEYTLEIIERGDHLQAEDAERIAAIKRRRSA
jgi:hypothetical protein